MLKLFLDCVVFLLGMAFMEGLLKPVVVYFTQREIRKVIPAVLSSVDMKLPQWLGTLDAEDIKTQVFTEITAAAEDADINLTEKDMEKALDTVVSVYSFLVNADKLKV